MEHRINHERWSASCSCGWNTGNMAPRFVDGAVKRHQESIPRPIIPEKVVGHTTSIDSGKVSCSCGWFCWSSDPSNAARQHLDEIQPCEQFRGTFVRSLDVYRTECTPGSEDWSYRKESYATVGYTLPSGSEATVEVKGHADGSMPARARVIVEAVGSAEVGGLQRPYPAGIYYASMKAILKAICRGCPTYCRCY